MAREPSDDRDDEALIHEHLRDRNGPRGRAAFGVLADRWSERVYRWAHRVVREREAALDIAQDCLIQMYEALPKYEARGRFGGWLFVIVHHRCMSHVRRRPLNMDVEIDHERLVAPGENPEGEYESAEELRNILGAMETVLEPNERAALWMRAYEGMSVDDITEVLNVTGPSGARGLLQTARRKLRAALGDRGRADQGGSE